MLELKRTISIYDDHFENNPSKYVEIHDITHRNGLPVLGTGRALTEQEGIEIFSLFTKSIKTKRFFLPENILMWHVDPMTESYSCVFWMKAHIAPIMFINDETYLVPWPPLVFIVKPNNFKIYALKANQRPATETTLYDLPAWNRYENGSVCLGNFSLPQTGSPDDVIKSAKSFWFDAEFSHAGVGAYAGLDIPHFWKDLNGEKKYPTKTLVKSSYKLGEII